MSENGIAKAEQRVREMNRVTRQYSEQGNDFMRQSRQRRQMQPARQTQQTQPTQQAQQTYQQPRFEPAAPQSPEPPRGECSAIRTSAGLPAVSGPDGEKLLILLIAFLLIKEKADVKLLLALAYILI